MSSSRVLPPKSIPAQGALERERNQLIYAIRTRCMSDHGCHDMPLAKDLLRSHTCSIFDTLKVFYSTKIVIFEWEKEIAEEAIDIAHACWTNFRDLPRADFSRESLRADIATHLGHALRSGPIQKAFLGNLPGVSDKSPVFSSPPSPYSLGAVVGDQKAATYAKAGIDPHSTSPLVIAAAMQANVGQETVAPPLPPPELSLVEQRKKLLEAYKAKTGASHKQIWEGKSGIHKPQFYEWVNGKLPSKSQTAQNFERFLREGKRPTPRKPRK